MENSEEGFVIEEKDYYYGMKNDPNSAVVTTKPATFKNNVWPSLKPFVTGCLASQLTHLEFQFMAWSFKDCLVKLAEQHPGRHEYVNLLKGYHAFRKRLPIHMLLGATYDAARFGSFEIFSTKLEAANNGIPLTMYQAAGCGLISGAIGGCIWYPFHVSSPSLQGEPAICRKLFNALIVKVRRDGLLTLWKGSGYYMTYQMFMNMGMLASYYQSKSYLRDSLSLSKVEAETGASVVSAFFATAICGSPFAFVARIKNIIMQTNTAKGTYSNSKRDLLKYSLQVLQPGGRHKFYYGLFRSFLLSAPYAVVQWNYLEALRGNEEQTGC